MVQIVNSVLSRGVVQVAYSVLSVEIDQRSGVDSPEERVRLFTVGSQ